MRRLALGTLVLFVGMAGVYVDHEVKQTREVQRLITDGDRAFLNDQALLAIEAYSGALALDPNSMAVYLKRGETYHKQEDFTAAVRDLSILEHERRARPVTPPDVRQEASGGQPREITADLDLRMGARGHARSGQAQLIAPDALSDAIRSHSSPSSSRISSVCCACSGPFLRTGGVPSNCTGFATSRNVLPSPMSTSRMCSLAITCGSLGI